MCDCNSQWRTTAEAFLASNQETPQGRTVRYLLENNHCGREQATYISTLAENLDYERTAFQHHVLIPLKQEGFIISLPYPGQAPGVFIPCNEDEIRYLARQTLSRVESEIGNIRAICETVNLGHDITLLQDALDAINL